MYNRESHIVEDTWTKLNSYLCTVLTDHEKRIALPMLNHLREDLMDASADIEELERKILYLETRHG